jgi:toxin ParE1/3/4
MAFEVILTESAERDIESICGYVAERASVGRAESVLAALRRTIDALAEMPERGNVPKELRELGAPDYRETHYKPYRIIYRIAGEQVIVYCAVDGRRDMRSLLERRLLG